MPRTVPAPSSTDWDLIEAASRGSEAERRMFADRYAALIRTLLAQRWRAGRFRGELDDAVQDVFVECFKTDGALAAVARRERRPFRPFLRGIVRNVALQHESRLQQAELRTRPHPDPRVEQQPDPGTTLTTLMDRELARSIVRLAAARMAERAERLGASARRRVEILRRRFQEDQPIREIARALAIEPDRCHHQYAKARADFGKALREVVGERWPGSPEEIERACRGLLELLE